jgi:hypothetical protein
VTAAAGEGLLHPVPLLAIVVLVLNDHVLKDLFHNAVTGKLSDFAGMAFFPLVLQGLIEGGLSVLRRPWTPSRRVLIGSAIATAVFFAGVQLYPPIADFYRWSLGLLQWPVVAISAGEWVPVRPVQVWADPTDLISLPAVGLAVWAGWSRAGT